MSAGFLSLSLFFLSLLFFFFVSCSVTLLQKKKKLSTHKKKKPMSGLYNNSSYFSPARAASPQIRSTPEIDRYVQTALIFSPLFFRDTSSFGFYRKTDLFFCFLIPTALSTCRSFSPNIKSLRLLCKSYRYAAACWIKVRLLFNHSSLDFDFRSKFSLFQFFHPLKVYNFALFSFIFCFTRLGLSHRFS